MIEKETKKTKETKKVSYDITVTKAKEFESGDIGFDMVANGVSIYGCYYKVRKKKDTGEKFACIDFPQKKGSNGNYYKEAYFFVDDETLAKIEEGIKAKLKEA